MQEGSRNKRGSGKGWIAIQLSEVRAQYTDNGKLTIQGKKKGKRRLCKKATRVYGAGKEHSRRKFVEDIAKNPYLRKKKQEHEDKQRIQENTDREEYLKQKTGLTTEEIRRGEKEGG